MARVSAVGLTLILFVVGGQPEVGLAFGGIYHLLVHVAAYASIAVAYGYAMPRLAWPLVALVVAALGGLHEYYEISAHHHPIEYPDIGINALGAMLGALARPVLAWLGLRAA